MAILSDTEIFDAALKAGFTPDQAVTMTAIALAESGGNTDALNPTGEHSVGLWQINTAVHDWDPAVAADPTQNARMAFEVSGGGADISRWTVTHDNKGARYLGFRARAEAAAAASGHADARGQWNPPHDYNDNQVGAAPTDSTSTALHEPGTIPETVDAVGTGAVAAADEPRPTTSAFDRDGDGVFDAVEEWLGEDLLPDHPGLPDLPDDPQFQPVGEPVDVSTLQNGRVAQEDLAAAVGGNDFLLAGAPSNSWNAMVAAAKADGVDITYSDTYRDLDHQHDIADRLGLFSQGGMAARPGTSNHGLGLAVDVDWRGDANSETRAWMLEHAASFGWEQHSAAREAHHFTYRPELDPDPDRWLGDGPVGADDDNPVGHAFDRDGDGVYDGIEDWLAAAGTPLPGGDDNGQGDNGHGDHAHGDNGHGDHAHGDNGHGDHAHGDHGQGDHAHGDHGHGDALGHAAGCQCGQCPGGQAHDANCQCPDCQGDDARDEERSGEVEALPPLDDADGSALADVLGRFELDSDGDLIVEELSGEAQAGLRSALADFVVERAEIDRESFFREFDESVTTGGGAIDIGDVLDSFGLDVDFDF